VLPELVLGHSLDLVVSDSQQLLIEINYLVLSFLDPLVDLLMPQILLLLLLIKCRDVARRLHFISVQVSFLFQPLLLLAFGLDAI